MRRDDQIALACSLLALVGVIVLLGLVLSWPGPGRIW